MSSFISTIFYFVITLGILITFHEFGHFWVARRAGVKVLKFSVGFGKKLWSFQKTPASTEYILAAIPLGGFVKMVDERVEKVSPEDKPFAFNSQSLPKRTAIVAAGPIFNLILAIFLFWLVYTLGETGLKPKIGPIEPETIAAKSGFVEGDEIIQIGNTPTRTWSEAISTLISQALDETDISVKVKAQDDEITQRVMTIPPSALDDPEELYKQLGFTPWQPSLPPLIDKVLAGGAAFDAGMKNGDLVTSANGKAVNTWEQWVDIVRDNADIAIDVVVTRNDVNLPLTVTPKLEKAETGNVGKIGASVRVPEGLRESMQIHYTLPPIEGLVMASKKTWEFSSATLKMLWRMLTGHASVENLSGPISIAQYAGESASMGLTHFLKYLAIVSISLGVINLLPIPVLDGGHLMFFAIEALKGSPVSDQLQLLFQQVGIAILITLMGLAMFLDIERLVS